ncbi:MAG TPA: hypothetical protein VGC34_15495 [Steroidobacteraceae bacterium]
MSSQELLAKLAAYDREKGDFHGDRRLADEILLACGWQVQANPEFEGGMEWWFGKNPRVSASQRSHPHPVNSLDDALGQLPFYCALAGVTRGIPFDYGGDWRVKVRDNRRFTYIDASHADRIIAVCIAAVTAWSALEPVQEKTDAA